MFPTAHFSSYTSTQSLYQYLYMPVSTTPRLHAATANRKNFSSTISVSTHNFIIRVQIKWTEDKNIKDPLAKRLLRYSAMHF